MGEQQALLDPRRCVVVVGQAGPLAAAHRYVRAHGPSTTVTCPPMAGEQVEKAWREVWMLLAAIACHADLQARGRPVGDVPPRFAGVGAHGQDGGSLVRGLAAAVNRFGSGAAAREWLMALDRDCGVDHWLLFDGMDSGLGRHSLTALAGLVGDLHSQLRNLRFKLFMREDIWNQVVFDNKSHLVHILVRLPEETRAGVPPRKRGGSR